VGEERARPVVGVKQLARLPQPERTRVEVRAARTWALGPVHAEVRTARTWALGSAHAEVRAARTWALGPVHGQVRAAGA